MYRFLLSPRWIGLLVFALFMFSACIWLGGWQHDRYEQRQTANDVIRGNYTGDPVDVEDVLADGWSTDLNWRTVTATGVFDPEHEVTVRFSQRDSRPGVDVVTPLRLDSGATVLVDRGWIESDRTGTAPDDIPLPPTGTVTITGWLQPDSTANHAATTPSNRQVRAIRGSNWADFLGTTPLTGHIAMTDPEQDGIETPVQPDLGSGPSLFYSIQWYFFAGLAAFGYFWFVRTEVKERRQAKLTRSA